MSTSKLMKVSYYDTKSEVRLECYADTIVIEKEGKNSYIVAIRLGGYPEPVKGMADAIFGGGSVIYEINEESHVLSSRTKQYRKEFSHDGLYAEAVLRIKDEEQRQIDSNDSDGGDNKINEPPPANAPRKCYIFCGLDDDEQLFEEIDKKISVPLIPEFKEYILEEFQCRDILKTLQVISIHDKFNAYILHMSSEETNIISVVEDGLFSGRISIPGATDTDFPIISGVTQYLNEFGIQIAERIKGQFNPLFDPATEALSTEILAVNDYIKANAGYSLYDAQLAVAETLKRRLIHGKVGLCIAECGSGKTKIGTTALHAYQQRLQFRKLADISEKQSVGVLKQNKYFNIVLCPSHMAKKWVREIEETLLNTFAVVVSSITEINEAYEAYQRDNKTCYIVITKEKARDGYMRRPVAVWNKRRKVFTCPDCYETIEMDLIDCGSKYRVPADPFFFRKETKQNHKCQNKDCCALLWTALVPEQQSEWVKVSEYGFVHRKMIRLYFKYVEKKPKIYEAIQAIADNPDGHFPNVGAYRRFPLSTYIKRHMKGKIDGLIVDELHNYNNNSGQGDAMGELLQVAKKVIGMTATLINGYSSGIFHLLFRVAPDLMLRDNKTYEKPIDFNDEYGVTESVYEIDAPDYNANRRTAKRKLRERQLPGVSPLVYSRFLMDSAAFLSLNDMGKDLPEYEEIPIELEMNDEVSAEYKRIENRFINILRYEKDIAQKILSVYLNLLTVYPDQPYGHEPVKHPIYGDDTSPLIVPENISSINELHEKDHQVLDIAKPKIEGGGRVLIYTSWTRIDTQAKLTKILTEQGYRVATLTTSVSPKKREEWVEKQVEDGIQVLITNPSLVETGLDLNDFTTIIYYNLSYNLFTLRQASRRSWRINQRAPRIEVYFLYYRDTMQHRAIRLMASKLAVAGVIEGNLTDEGLAAMSDCQDMTTALARELTQGIEGEVEDLGSVFKRMALLKPVEDVINNEDEVAIVNPSLLDVVGDAVIIDNAEVDIDIIENTTTILDDDIDIIDDTAIVAEPKPQTPIKDTSSTTKKEQVKQPKPSGLISMIQAPKPKQTTTTKNASSMVENQLSLFDLMEYSA